MVGYDFRSTVYRLCEAGDLVKAEISKDKSIKQTNNSNNYKDEFFVQDECFWPSDPIARCDEDVRDQSPLLPYIEEKWSADRRAVLPTDGLLLKTS